MDGYSLCKRHQHRTVATSNVNATSTQSGYVVQNYFGKTSGTFRRELRRNGNGLIQSFIEEATHKKAISNELRVPFVKHNSFGGFFTIKRTVSSRYIYNSLRGMIKNLRRISTTTTRIIFCFIFFYYVVIMSYIYDSTYR